MAQNNFAHREDELKKEAIQYGVLIARNERTGALFFASPNRGNMNPRVEKLLTKKLTHYNNRWLTYTEGN